MINKRQLLFIIIIFLISLNIFCNTNKITKDFSSYFKRINSEGCIIIYDNNAKSYTTYNEKLVNTGILPASTFKIYNSLIGLESQVAKDDNYVINWDGTQYPYKSWNQDHTLKSAIKYSVVWYYKELARRIGKKRMQEYLNKLNYGNKNIKEGIDTFWLKGKMKITAKEQVELLKQLYNSTLPFSKKHQATVKEMIILQNNENYKLSGKTGTIARIKNIYYSRFVGYVETNSNIYFFATNLKKTKSEESINYGEAKKISLEILKHLDIIK